MNLGTAVNSLMEEEVCQRLNKGDALRMESHHLHYCNFSGTTELKGAVADFLNKHFKPSTPITPGMVISVSNMFFMYVALKL